MHTKYIYLFIVFNIANIIFIIIKPDFGFCDEISRRDAIVKVVEKVGPAVVNINTETRIREESNPFFSFRDPFFDEYFRRFFEPYYRERVYQSLGSGFIIDKKGYILTNEHVVRMASKIMITLSDEREFESVVIGADKEWDIAVLEIKDEVPLPAIEMGSSSDLMIGETVIAIGNPFGLSHSVTTGVISALHRSIKTEDRVYNDFIQTDALINPGNSGGPLLNIKGEVVGVNSAVFVSAQGIGFAIPVDRAKRVVKDLITYGEVHFAWVGIRVQNLIPKLKEYFGYEGNHGVLVIGIEDDSPAEKLGLMVGDIIITINGRDVESKSDYFDLMREVQSGEKAALSIFRKGKVERVSIKSGKYPSTKAEGLGYELLGIKVRRGRKGVIINEVKPDSPADDIGLMRGDVLLRVGGKEIKDMDDFQSAILNLRGRSSVLISIQRGNFIYRVVVEY